MEPHNSRDVHVFGIKCNAILRGLSVIVPIYDDTFAQGTQIMRGRTCQSQHSPPSRYHRARKVPAESAGAVAR